MILLDTHSAVWVSSDRKRLSNAAVTAIRKASREAARIAIASSTLWEISMLSSKGRILLPTPLTAYLRYLERTFIVLPITAAIAERSTLLTSAYPSDPTDRIIGATAVVHGLRLITSDKAILASGEVDCVW